MDLVLQQILEKVLTLYQKYGIRSITMDDVSRELGISKRTLYQYIKDKEELVRHSIMFFSENNDCFHKLIEEKQLNALQEVVELYKYLKNMLLNYNHSLHFDLQKYYPEIHRKMLEDRRQRMIDWVVSNIEKGKEEGVYRSEIRADIIAKMQIVRVEYIMTNNYVSVHDFLQDDFFNEVFTYHIYGICTPKGIEIFKTLLTELNFNKL